MNEEIWTWYKYREKRRVLNKEKFWLAFGRLLWIVFLVFAHIFFHNVQTNTQLVDTLVKNMNLSVHDIIYMRGSSCGIVANVHNNNIVASSNSSKNIMFTFRLIPFRKIWTSNPTCLWVNLYYYGSSTRLVLSLDNPQMLICH